MSRNKVKLLGIFVLTTLFFCCISIFLRDLLIHHFDNIDFKVFTIDYIKNYGAAFSLFHTKTNLLIVISFAIFIIMLFYIVNNIFNFSRQDFFFSAMLTSGILCNLSERIIDGFVTDYIRLNMVSFPIFNISDLFICIGAFALICNILFNNEQQA